MRGRTCMHERYTDKSSTYRKSERNIKVLSVTRKVSISFISSRSWSLFLKISFTAKRDGNEIGSLLTSSKRDAKEVTPREPSVLVVKITNIYRFARTLVIRPNDPSQTTFNGSQVSLLGISMSFLEKTTASVIGGHVAVNVSSYEPRKILSSDTLGRSVMGVYRRSTCALR